MGLFKVAIFMVVFYLAMAVSDYQQDALKQHNAMRRIHNARPLKLNKQLSDDANRYAQELVDKYLRSHALKHSPKRSRPGVGENLSLGCTTARGVEGRTVKSAIKEWYDEVCKYRFHRPGFALSTGHFTQVVWRATTELGIGKKSGSYTASDGKKWTCTYIVGRYKAVGNVEGQFRENVQKGNFNRSYCNSV